VEGGEGEGGSSAGFRRKEREGGTNKGEKKGLWMRGGGGGTLKEKIEWYNMINVKMGGEYWNGWPGGKGGGREEGTGGGMHEEKAEDMGIGGERGRGKEKGGEEKEGGDGAGNEGRRGGGGGLKAGRCNEG